MFGYMLFNGKSGNDNFSIPESYQEQARKDVESHINNLSNYQGNSKSNGLLNRFSKRNREHKRTKEHRIIHEDTKYKSSPLRQTLAVSTLESSDDCSTIDSGKSGCSLSAASAQYLMHQQQEELSRVNTMSTNSVSLFDSIQVQSIYTGSTAMSSYSMGLMSTGLLSLNDALPTTYEDYYSPDLDVPKFSNGRPKYTKRPLKNWELNDLRSLLIYPSLKPEWNNKIPQIESPYPNMAFRIQIIPNYLNDNQLIDCLAQSDIYKEANFDLNFKQRTATFIIEKARLRHRQLLIASFNIPELAFNNKSHLTNNIEYDSYFKFEWRNIIENYLLNLAIEYQCRTDFKVRIQKFKQVNEQKCQNFNTNNKSNSNSNSKFDSSSMLYKKTLIRQGMTVNDDMKKDIWKEVQANVYNTLELDNDYWS